MAKVSERVSSYLESNDNCLLEPDALTAIALRAVRFYMGWTSLEAKDLESDPPFALSDDTDISDSEWSIIGPLFDLYAEKAQAISIESTQVMGVMQFGRSSSEIQSDITVKEEALPRLAFNADPFEIE